MSLITKKKIFYVDSGKRISGTNSDFLYNLDLQKEDYDMVVILQANIPKSYYLVESGYNTFTLKEDTLIAQITIPIGNYTRSNLRTTVQALLTAQSPNGYQYFVTVPSSNEVETGKYTFLVTGNAGQQPQFIFGDYVYEFLGFDRNSVNTFTSDTLISTNL